VVWSGMGAESKKQPQVFDSVTLPIYMTVVISMLEPSMAFIPAYVVSSLNRFCWS
jgi:hypothetical protein